jgi:hypothetical protein
VAAVESVALELGPAVAVVAGLAAAGSVAPVSLPSPELESVVAVVAAGEPVSAAGVVADEPSVDEVPSGVSVGAGSVVVDDGSVAVVVLVAPESAGGAEPEAALGSDVAVPPALGALPLGLAPEVAPPVAGGGVPAPLAEPPPLDGAVPAPLPDPDVAVVAVDVAPPETVELGDAADGGPPAGVDVAVVGSAIGTSDGPGLRTLPAGSLPTGAAANSLSGLGAGVAPARW